MNKILVVGGAGYVGTPLCVELDRKGYDVSIVDLLWFGNNLPDNLKSKVKVADVLDLIPKDLEEFHTVIFVAGLSNDPMADYSPAKNFIFNAASPAYLAYIAKKAGVKRLIYASSCSVYGYTVDECYDETGPTKSVYPYGISKLQGESSVLQLADENFSVISLRKGTVSGVSPRMRFDLVVNTMFKSAMTTGTIFMNDPSVWRPILSLKDCVSAYVNSVESDLSISGIFNIASGNYRVEEIANIVKTIIEKQKNISLNIVNNNIKDVRNYKVSCEKANNILGFKSLNAIESIVQELIQYDGFGDMENPNYYNIKTFSTLM